ncbi:hypothetical protein E2C01_023989 [Portunus trituberculatus]|uniref:Uncharacterized protein n=1 Tax=Portunus trituberculatus TaxID=210409 RepID=A0A5B7EBI4_PORTR|nr:hypothetical protein [Portunus trituberculatus]
MRKKLKHDKNEGKLKDVEKNYGLEEEEEEDDEEKKETEQEEEEEEEAKKRKNKNISNKNEKNERENKKKKGRRKEQVVAGQNTRKKICKHSRAQNKRQVNKAEKDGQVSWLAGWSFPPPPPQPPPYLSTP